MKVIKSQDNTLYKSAAKLIRKKYRDETGLYMLEGVKPLFDALDSGTRIKHIFICDGVKTVIDLPTDANEITVSLSKKLFQNISQTETSQGVIAVAEKKEYSSESFAAEVAKGNGNVIVLDRLQDPGNIGTIIRTAEAAGYSGVIVLAGSGDIYSPKVVRAAAGSLFRVPITYMGSGEEAIDFIKAMDKKIVATCLQTDIYYGDVDLSTDIALVVGNEGQGIGEALMRAADIKIKIPMEGSIESLNAAVSAGILMYRSHEQAWTKSTKLP